MDKRTVLTPSSGTERVSLQLDRWKNLPRCRFIVFEIRIFQGWHICFLEVDKLSCVHCWWLSMLGTSLTDKLPAQEEQTDFDPAYMVKWDRDDPLNPQNWSVRYKWWVTFQLGMLALAGSLGSSIMTPADGIIAQYVGVSSEVAVLDVSLYL